MSQTKAQALFKCPTCGKEYANHSSLRSHRETHNGMYKPHEAEQFAKKYKLRAALLEQKRLVHAEIGRCECDKCGKIFPHKNALNYHKLSVHSAWEFECSVCGKKLRAGSLYSHMETHAGQPCECDVCGKILRHPSSLAQHKQRAHSEAKHRCEHCGKIFGMASALRQHAAIHGGQPCECDICGKTCRHPTALAVHKRSAHSEAKHRCEQCGRIFSGASALCKHMAVHAEEHVEYPCDRCMRTFKSPAGRENHIRIEHSNSSFTCDYECGLHSATRLKYLEHLKSRHAEQHPATCKCNSIDVHVSRQVAKHLGQTMFEEPDGRMKCTDGGCDFPTTCARQMESHKEQCHHDAYRPALRCRSCETWFRTPKNLRRHIAGKHQGERRFKCDGCGYITNNKGTLIRHQTRCQQGKARGNRRVKRSEPMIDNLDVKKESPHAVYRFGSMIGEGGFGKVYEAVKKGEDPPVKYAIKKVGPNGGKSAELEAKRMRQFEHKNLMALLEYYEWQEEGRLTRFIVMECCRPGSLTTMQKFVQFQLKEPHVLYVMKEVTCGLEHLHRVRTVIVNEQAEVKITDFGVSTDERIAFNCRGTPGWEAPEVVAASLTGITGLKSAYTQKADVYSVGVLAIDCFLPRETLPTDFFHKKKVESESFAETQLQRIEEDRRLQLSEAFKGLVTRCLEPMTTRLSAADVQKVPAVKKASVDPFQALVEECLRRQEEKRNSRRRKQMADTEASSLLSSPTPRSGLLTTSTAASVLPTSSGGRHQQPSFSSTSSLFSAPIQRSQQAPMSTGMSSLFSAAPTGTHREQPTANTTVVSSLFPESEAHSQQASTSGDMSSLFFSTASSRPGH